MTCYDQVLNPESLDFCESQYESEHSDWPFPVRPGGPTVDGQIIQTPIHEL
jgi:hypothetical protein